MFCLDHQMHYKQSDELVPMSALLNEKCNTHSKLGTLEGITFIWPLKWKSDKRGNPSNWNIRIVLLNTKHAFLYLSGWWLSRTYIFLICQTLTDRPWGDYDLSLSLSTHCSMYHETLCSFTILLRYKFLRAVPFCVWQSRFWRGWVSLQTIQKFNM